MIKKRVKLSLIATMIITTVGSSSEYKKERMPITAKAGQCFTKSFYPPEFTKTIRTTSTKRVLIRKESIIQKVIPAKYEWIENRVKISDGKEKIVTTPAIYKTVYEKILVEPAKQTWRKNLKLNAKKAFNSCVQSASSLGVNISNAKEGSCFYEHYKAEKYITTTEKILASEASSKIVSTPAKYRTYTKKIVIDSTNTKLIPIKAKYKKVKENVVVAPARMEWTKTTCQNRGCNQSEVVCLTEIPRKYKSVTRKILLEPSVAKEVAISPKYKSVKVEKLVKPSTSKVVLIPAKYKTIEKTEKVKDSTYFWTDESGKYANSRITDQCNKICLTKTPAKYKKVAKRLLVRPASSKKIKTPPKYKFVKVKKIIKEAYLKKVTVPAEYKTVSVERERTKGFSKWMPIVCEGNMTPTTIRKVQEALKKAGFYNGLIDGIWSFESKSATRAYQKANGLAVTRLSIETMKSLGVY